MRRLINGDIRAVFTALAEIFGLDSLESSEPSDKSLIALPAKLYAQQGYWSRPRVYTIKLPKETDWRPDQSTLLISRVVQLGRVILRIKATRDEIVWQLIDANIQALPADEVKRAIRSAFVEADVSEPELCFATEVGDGFWRRMDFYQQSGEYPRPSLRANDIHRTDPFMGIVNSFVDLQEHEWASYSLAFGDMGDEIEKLFQVGVESITTSKAGAVVWDVAGAVLSQRSIEGEIGAADVAAVGGAIWGGRPAKYDEVTMKACGEKLNEIPPIRCFVVIEANSPVRQRLDHFEYGVPFMHHFSTEYRSLPTPTNQPFRLPTPRLNNELMSLICWCIYLLFLCCHLILVPAFL